MTIGMKGLMEGGEGCVGTEREEAAMEVGVLRRRRRKDAASKMNQLSCLVGGASERVIVPRDEACACRVMGPCEGGPVLI
jgi:hypothetical protein